MGVEKKRAFIINVIYFLMIVAIGYVVVKYAIGWFLPFVIGFGIAFLLKPIINFTTKKTKMKRKAVAGITVLLFHATIGTLVALGITKLILLIKELAQNLPSIYANTVEPVIYQMFNSANNFMTKLDPSLIQASRDNLESIKDSLNSIAASISSFAVHILSSTVLSIPEFLLMLLISIISSFFFAMDYVNITSFIRRQFSQKTIEIMIEIKNATIGTIVSFLKAYSVIILTTFTELSIGLSILGVKGAISVALSIACFDVMPVVGTGCIIIPWAISNFLQGNVKLGVGLLVLYLIILIVRNVLEPKVVGDQVGLHPIVMLLCIFVGAELLGVFGIIALPVTVIILKRLNDSGKIKIFK